MSHSRFSDRVCSLCFSTEEQVATRVVQADISPHYAWSNGLEELEYGDGTRAHDPLRKTMQFHGSSHNVGLGKKGRLLFRPHATPHLSGVKKTVRLDGMLQKVPITLGFLNDPRVDNGWARPFRCEERYAPLISVDPRYWESNPQLSWMSAATIDDTGRENGAAAPAMPSDSDAEEPRRPGPRFGMFVHWDCMQVLLAELVGKRIDADITPDDWLSLNHKALGMAMYSIFQCGGNVDMLKLQRRIVTVSYVQNLDNGMGPTPFVKPGVFQKLLTRLLFRSPRFQQAQRIPDRELTEGPLKNDPPMGPILGKLPLEVLLLVLSYLEPEEIRNTQLVCRSLRLLFESEEFWGSWLRHGGYNRILPELLDAIDEGIRLCARGEGERPKWRQVAGWLEAISTPTNRYTGWGMILECRLRILKMADVVSQRYHNFISAAPCVLENAQNTYCMSPTLPLTHHNNSDTYDLRLYRTEIYKSYPFVSVSLIPGINGSVVRIGQDADKPMIQLSPHFDPEDSNVLRADDLVVLIEFGLSENLRQRISRIVHITLHTKNGVVISLPVPGHENAPVKRVVFYDAPLGFIFLDQIYCPVNGKVGPYFDMSTNSSYSRSTELEIVAFRGATLGPFDGPRNLGLSPLSRVYWSAEIDRTALVDSFMKRHMEIVPEISQVAQAGPMYFVGLESPEELTQEPVEWCVYRQGSPPGPIRGVKKPGHAVVGIDPAEAENWPKQNIDRFRITRTSKWIYIPVRQNGTEIVMLESLIDGAGIPSHGLSHDYPRRPYCYQGFPLLCDDGEFRGLAWNGVTEHILKWR